MIAEAPIRFERMPISGCQLGGEARGTDVIYSKYEGYV